MRTSNPDTTSTTLSRFNEYPFFAPRCWHAMSVSRWLGLLQEHGFRFDRYPMAIGVSILAPIVSTLNRAQHFLHWKKAVATPRQTDPTFVIGHWRTGTTFLQYLLGHDTQRHVPDTWECMGPEQFIVSRYLTRFMSCPNRRPMDNIQMGWQKPQEDEFALCIRGATSVFRHFAFPNEPNRHLESLTMDSVSSKDLAHWKETLDRFVTYLNYHHEKPLLFKSPSHTGRIHTLLEMYPNAKFLHITRSPFDFIPSTTFLWESLDATSGLQRDVDQIDHEDYVFDCFRRMYGSYERRKCLIPAGNLCEITYEQLVSNPIQTLRFAYDSLGMDGLNEALPAIKAHLNAKRDYKRNEHHLSPRLRARIEDECGEYFQRYCQPATPLRRAA